MLRSLPLGKAFGIPLSVHPTFLLLPALVAFQTWGAGPEAVLLSLAVLLTLFGCVLLHELGHALMARSFGIGTRDITLYPIGGVARLERMSERPAEEVCIALAGPAVNLALVILLAPLVFLALVLKRLPADPLGVAPEAGPAGLLASFLCMVMAGNAFLLLFNLLPAFPMDGGRVLRALLALGLGQVRATEIAVRVGMGMALLFMVAAYNWTAPMLWLIALFVPLAGQMELLALRRREALRQAEARADWPAPAPAPPAAPAWEVGPSAAEPNFSGLAWDPARRAWVLWHEGRAVSVFGARAE